MVPGVWSQVGVVQAQKVGCGYLHMVHRGISWVLDTVLCTHSMIHQEARVPKVADTHWEGHSSIPPVLPPLTESGGGAVL